MVILGWPEVSSRLAVCDQASRAREWCVRACWCCLDLEVVVSGMIETSPRLSGLGAECDRDSLPHVTVGEGFGQVQDDPAY